jgi:NADH-quinone oxidoreductase subunit C
MPAATSVVPGPELAERIAAAVPDSVARVDGDAVVVDSARLLEVCCFLRDDSALNGQYLNNVSGVDWFEYFEVVYNITSLSRNQTFTIKSQADHDAPEVPSVSSIWHGAHLQEREIYDLLGIRFRDHPDLKRLFLWEGFPGHPLRKDYRSLPGGEHPGLQRFPKEDPKQWGGEFRGD